MPQWVEVECVVAPEDHSYRLADLRLRLELVAGPWRRTVERRVGSDTNRFTISTKGLPAGAVTLDAMVRLKREDLATRSWALRRLTPEETRQMKVHVDPANRLIVDGQPFFPLGWYGSANDTHLAELADSPFNCLLAYGTDYEPKERMLRFLDRMQTAGLKLVYCMNDVYPTAIDLEAKGWEGLKGNDAIASAVVAAYRHHPAILAWYLNDEIPHKLVPQLTDYYQRVRNADPAHPCFIVLCNRSELPYFPATTDIFGVDPYPIPQDPITREADFVTAARRVKAGNCRWLGRAGRERACPARGSRIALTSTPWRP